MNLQPLTHIAELEESKEPNQQLKSAIRCSAFIPIGMSAKQDASEPSVLAIGTSAIFKRPDSMLATEQIPLVTYMASLS